MRKAFLLAFLSLVLPLVSKGQELAVDMNKGIGGETWKLSPFLAALNGIKSLGGDSSLFLTPQLYIGLVKRRHVALSVGTQIPIAGEKSFDYRIVSFLLWEYLDGGLWW